MQLDGRHNVGVYGTDRWRWRCRGRHLLGFIQRCRGSSTELPGAVPRLRGFTECLLQLLGVQIHNGFCFYISISATVVCDHGTATRDMCAATPAQATLMRCSSTCARSSGVQPVCCSRCVVQSRKSGVSAVVVECDSYMTHIDIHTQWQ